MSTCPFSVILMMHHASILVFLLLNYLIQLHHHHFFSSALTEEPFADEKNVKFNIDIFTLLTPVRPRIMCTILDYYHAALEAVELDT